MQVIVTLLVILFSTSVHAIENTTIEAPDNDTIVRWAKLDNDAKVEKIIPISLDNGEKAFLAEIDRFRGRNNMYGAYLVRPFKKDALEISGSVLDVLPIPVDSNESNRLAVIKTGASGQGSEEYTWSLMHFNNWKAMSLYVLNFSNFSNCISDSGPQCGKSVVEWKFSESAKHLGLTEIVISASWGDLSVCNVPAERTVKVIKITDMKISTESITKSKTTLGIDPCFPKTQTQNPNLKKLKKPKEMNSIE